MEGSVAFSGASVAAEVGSLPYADQVARLHIVVWKPSCR